MPDWDLLAQVGAQGIGFYWAGTYAPGATYVINSVVQYGGSSWIAVAAGILGQPNITPSQWQPLVLAGANNSTVLSEGDVGTGFVGPASLASSTQTWVDVTGCVVAPNVVTPIALQIRGTLSLASSNAALTNYRLWMNVVDDLGASVGLCVIRQPLSNTPAGGVLQAIAADIEVTPNSTGRVYKLQTSMNDGTGGTCVFGGTGFGGNGNRFRLSAVNR